jgi:hypothetical protein
MEELHWDLFFAFVKLLQLGVLNGNILLNILARQHNLGVFAATVDAIQGPVSHSSGYARQNEHEYISLEASIFNNGEEGLEDVRNDDKQTSKMKIVEGAIAFSKTN